MKFFKFPLNCLLIICLIVLSCEKNEAAKELILTGDIVVASVDITTETKTLLKSATTQLSVSVLPSNATNKAVEWSSSDETIATVSSNGLVTAVSVGETNIEVKSLENEKIIDNVLFTITGNTSNDITSAKINGNLGVIDGTKITFEFLEGSEVSSLLPTIVHTGVHIVPESQTAQDFTNPVIYTVTSENGDVQQWEIAVDLKPIPTTGSKFITTWKTDNPGASEDNQITIPTFSIYNYSYMVEWGDGTSDLNVTGDITHTYSVAGTYTVSISGEFPAIYFANPFNKKEGDDDKILSINQWGTIKWKSMTNAFAGCDNLDVMAYDIPDFSNGLMTNFMFAACPSLVGNTSMNFWDVSTVTNMNLMFQKCPLFNQDISDWDVSAANGLNGMLAHCTSFNQDIGSWNVTNVENFGSLFAHCSSFNQDISGWDVGNATSMNGMFLDATSFNQDISNWKVDKVDDMTLMFSQANAFNQNLGKWDIGQVLFMGGIFNETALTTENYDAILKGWNELTEVQNGVRLGAENIAYCQSESDRQNLINTHGWIISDGGKDCN